MKKIFVSMMLATALLVGGSAYAQTTDGNTGATQKKEQCDNCKGDKSGKSKKDGKGKKAMRSQFNPFDGIQLTPDQQQRLQVLQQGLGPVVLDKAQQEKIPMNKDLTPEQKKQLKEEKKAQKQEAKKNYLKGVKETLTPDQYVIFLENCYLYSAPAQGPGRDGSIKPGKGMHQGDKSHKGKKDGKGKSKNK